MQRFSYRVGIQRRKIESVSSFDTFGMIKNDQMLEHFAITEEKTKKLSRGRKGE
jgi:hypothetical protein